MKLVVTGAGGLLGSESVRSLSGAGHTVVGLSHGDLDVADAGAVGAALERHAPDAVLHCAARADVDGCERDADEAFRINRDAAGIVARAASDVGAAMVYYSTDYVFDGHASEPYAPDHPRNPLSLYARSKAEGEDAVLSAPGRTLVIRVSWLYGGARGGFPRFVVDWARAGKTLRLVTDQRSRPSWARSVARNTVELLERGGSGVWHLADGGDTTRVDQAREILDMAGLDAAMEGVTRVDIWPDVPRPAYTVLDLSATEAFLGRTMMPWPEATRRWLAEELPDGRR